MGNGSFRPISERWSQELCLGYSCTPSAHNYQMQAIYLYKRTLSAAEIQQNYQALRGRFGV